MPTDRSIFDSAHDAFVAMDADGLITAWNPAAESTFGWTRDEAIGRMVSQTMIPPQFREAHDEGMKRYLRSGEANLLDRRLEMQALHRDGHEFPIEMTISAVEDGGSTSFYSFLHDISERKQDERYRSAQLAVGATIASARSLEDAMPAAIAAIGGGYDFEAGAFWGVDDDGQLRCKTFWSADSSSSRSRSRAATSSSGPARTCRAWPPPTRRPPGSARSPMTPTSRAPRRPRRLGCTARSRPRSSARTGSSA